MEIQGSLGSLAQADSYPPQPHAYQHPTSSSSAKLARSVSVGENPGLAAEPQAPVPVRVSPLNKLTLPSRAHLVLDIPKPLPDRPALTSFSPVTKGRGHTGADQSSSLAGQGKAHTTCERRACLGEGTTPKPRTECQVHPGPAHPCAQQLPVINLLQGPESLQPPSPEKTPNPMECTRPGAALSQDSGAHSSQSHLSPTLFPVSWPPSGSISCMCVQPLAFFVLSAPVLVHKSHP